MTAGMRKSLPLLLLLGLTACISFGRDPDFTLDTDSATVKAGGYNDGNAHVYAFLGTRQFFLLNWRAGSPANFFVNGENVGGVDKNQFLFVDLPPGTYNFAWQERGSNAAKASPAPFTLAPNQNLFVAFDSKSGGGTVADRSDDGVQSIQDLKMVRPDQALVENLKPAGP